MRGTSWTPGESAREDLVPFAREGHVRPAGVAREAHRPAVRRDMFPNDPVGPPAAAPKADLVRAAAQVKAQALFPAPPAHHDEARRIESGEVDHHGTPWVQRVLRLSGLANAAFVPGYVTSPPRTRANGASA